MRKTLLLLFTLLCVAFFVSPAFAEMKNELDNFRGVPWRMAPPRSKKNQWGLVEYAPIAGPFQKVYERKNEKLHLGDAKIVEVHYFFHRNLGFASVDIRARGQENYELMRKVCIKNWGKPDKDVRRVNKKYDTDVKETVWVGKNLTAELSSHVDVDYATTLRIYLNEYILYVRRDAKEMLQRMDGF